MFPIGSTIPRDAETFRKAMAEGLAPLGLSAAAFSLQGEFPRFDQLRIDLSGARLHRGLRPARAGAGREPLCFARELAIEGNPVRVEDAPVEVSLTAQDVVLAAAEAADGSGKVAVLERATGGRLLLSIARAELEKALLAVGEAAARSKGADLKRVDLKLESESPRALRVHAIVTAKAMMFTTTVTISGLVEVDDALNARLRDLDCDGDGMVGKMAAGILRPQFEKLQQRAFPLGGAVAGLALTDVQISGGEALQIHAKFGSAA